jgi:hypothetical protein
MQPIENELREVLARQTAPAGFTARVMQAVRAEHRARRSPVWRWGAIGAVAASLVVGAYVRHERKAQARHVAAEQAGADLMLSLQVAGSKINKAREAVWRSPAGDTQ